MLYTNLKLSVDTNFSANQHLNTRKTCRRQLRQHFIPK